MNQPMIYSDPVGWMAASIMATMILSGGPLILGECFVRIYRRATNGAINSEILKSRDRLRFSTGIILAGFALWFWFDYLAIMAGKRSLAISVANLLSFSTLFCSWTTHILFHSSGHDDGTSSQQAVAQSPALPKQLIEILPKERLQAIYVGVCIVTIFVLASFLTSANDVGYRAKGILMCFAGVALFGLGFQRLRKIPATTDQICEQRRKATRLLSIALGYFLVCELAAYLTLTLNWELSGHRWIGVSSQVLVGLVGFIGCAQTFASEHCA